MHYSYAPRPLSSPAPRLSQNLIVKVIAGVVVESKEYSEVVEVEGYMFGKLLGGPNTGSWCAVNRETGAQVGMPRPCLYETVQVQKETREYLTSLGVRMGISPAVENLAEEHDSVEAPPELRLCG